jgi:parvulin-like peptidyl-prolyl isomerase
MSKRKEKEQQEEVQRELTRKEQLLRHRDRERHKKLYTFVGIALGLALALIVVGIVYQFMVLPNTAAAKVGNKTVTAADFQKRAKYERSMLANQLAQYERLEQQFGGQGFFQAQIAQLQSTLASPFALGNEALDTMVEDIVIAEEAARRGITVSDEEIDTALREEIANGLGLVTESQASATATAAVDATATAAAWTPTPTATVDPSVVVTATATPIPTVPAPPPAAVITETTLTQGMGTLEQSLQSIAGMSMADYRAIVTARLLRTKLAEAVGGETVTPTEEQVRARHILLRVDEPLPTPEATGEITGTVPATGTATVTSTTAATATAAVTGTAAVTTSAATTATATVTNGASVAAGAVTTATSVVTDAAGITSTVVTTATSPVTATVAADAGPRDDAATLALANELRARILAGEDFAVLAQEYSDDTGSAVEGGDLGWFGKGMMVAPFEEAAFSLPVGEVSEPVKTDFGYHLIEVLEKDAERPKDESALANERAQAFDAWLQEQLASDQVERTGNLQDILPPGF